MQPTTRKQELFNRGVEVLQHFCKVNNLQAPEVVQSDEPKQFTSCAFYRNNVIKICVLACAAVHRPEVPRQWSFPGYTVDRTPYGVLQHELGHHIDVLYSTRKGNYYGDYSIGLRRATDERSITSYCPNDAEWFAEIFRLFVTNPDLLRLLRPRTYAQLAARFNTAFTDDWRSRLAEAPETIINAVTNKLPKSKGFFT